MAAGTVGVAGGVDSPWAELERELDRWREEALAATFWWRDDDAGSPTGAFERLADLSARHDAPLVVAAVPAHSEEALARRVRDSSTLVVAQHGHDHVDLSSSEQPGRAELDAMIPDDDVLARLDRGRRRMTSLFGARFEPVVVPPWNRISRSLCARLPERGFRAVSTFGPRRAPEPVAGLRQVNAHCDIVDWKRGVRFRGNRRAVEDLVEHLAMRRVGAVDWSEPTGLLTHHLDHDEDCWRFLDDLLEVLGAHPASQLLGREAFRQ